ncbi:MAG: type IA DNA topoisomerase [Cellulosilyticum sp.]|nr:type IA DNA topoisomerase [Cellulosilyticum sp.]
MKKVVIAEKPSVAKNIADAFNIKIRKDGYFEGEQYLITWAFGHLLQLYDAKDYDERMKKWELEKFPFIPETFKYKVKSDSKNKAAVDPGAQKQIQIIKTLIGREDVDGIISATDYDREGQVIADEIFLYLRQGKPIYRILLNEWTPEEVKKGMERLKPNEEMQSLQDAGMGRQWADWIIGINLTSAATVKYGTGEKRLLNIGRVLLPTLKIVYDRDKEIAEFQSSTYHKLLAHFKTEKGEFFETTYYEKNEEDKPNEKFEDKAVLEKIQGLIKGKSGKVIEKQVEQKKEYAPLLFNLSNLQGYVTSKYKGWTSDKVLKVAQSLYEKKYITYPRTGSMALEESLKDRTKKVLDTLKVGLPYENQLKFATHKRIFDNAKVESHSAICPTYMKPKGLTADENIVYEAIKNRFLMQFLPIAEFEETKLTVKIEEPEVKGDFIAKGKVQLVEGWQVIEKPDSKDTVLPYVVQNEQVALAKSSINAVTRKPPKLHTEKTLLKIMETCGKAFKGEEDSEEMMASILSGFSIGTPATRAETIKKLKDTGYIMAKGKSLTCTELGKSLVEHFPVKELFDLEYTGRLEKTLSDIERGKFQKDTFLNMIKDFTSEAVGTIKEDSSGFGRPTFSKESVGKCPLCGHDIIETERAFGCSNWKSGCKYTIWKGDKYIAALGKEVTRPMVELLLKNGKVGFKNLKSKKGTTFAAYLFYEKNEQTGYFTWRMEFI